MALAREPDGCGRPKTADYSVRLCGTEGQLISVEQYLRMIRTTRLIDLDGMGEAVRDGYVARSRGRVRSWILPSDGARHVPEDATHILWHSGRLVTTSRRPDAPIPFRVPAAIHP